MDVGRTERSEFRHCTKMPEFMLFVPACEAFHQTFAQNQHADLSDRLSEPLRGR
jgi:hypothetical protein